MLLKVLLFIYGFTFLLCAASYFFYPFFILLIGRLRPFFVRRNDIAPPVSIIISAYNEGRDILNKIKNTLALDYPHDRMEILIGSDGSSDNTVEIAKSCMVLGVKVFDFKENRGKTSVQNDLVAEAVNDIVVFTDAASFLPGDALKKLVRNFADERVGCVAGKMRFVDTDKNITTQSQGIYWRYEICIRELESALGSLVGVDGPLYAVRKSNYVPLAAHIISDLMTPLLVLGQGKKVILEPEAFVDEEPKERSFQEFDTRRRITLRGMVGIFSYPELINPFKYPLLSMQIVFHKIIRWSIGLLVMLNVISCILLALFVGCFQCVLIVYGIFFVAAISGWFAAMCNVNVKILSVPYYFCLVNLAATMGVIDFLMGKQAVTWRTIR